MCFASAARRRSRSTSCRSPELPQTLEADSRKPRCRPPIRRRSDGHKRLGDRDSERDQRSWRRKRRFSGGHVADQRGRSTTTYGCTYSVQILFPASAGDAVEFPFRADRTRSAVLLSNLVNSGCVLNRIPGFIPSISAAGLTGVKPALRTSFSSAHPIRRKRARARSQSGTVTTFRARREIPCSTTEQRWRS